MKRLLFVLTMLLGSALGESAHAPPCGLIHDSACALRKRRKV